MIAQLDRRLLVALGVLVVAVLAGTLLLRSGGEDPASVPLVGASAAPDAVATPEPSNPSQEAPATFEVFAARDPFQQLVSDTTAASTTVASADPVATSTPAPAPTATPDPAPAEAPPAQTGTATTVRLVDVFTDTDGQQMVLATVDGTGYEVAEGERFASAFTVTDITGQCATFRGESRFLLCEGEQIAK